MFILKLEKVFVSFKETLAEAIVIIP